MKELYQKKLTIILFLLLIILSAGCATSYKTVNPSSFTYTDEQIVSDTLKVSYLYDIQKISRNKRYSKKEKKWGMAAVAVKIENISPLTVSLDRDKFKIFSENGQKYEYPISVYTKRVKQRVLPHFLHTLYGPWSFRYQEDMSTGKTDFQFRIIPIGAIIGIANASVAGAANGKHRNTLENNSIWRQQIPPGKTLFGIILIPSNKQEPLNFAFSESGAL